MVKNRRELTVFNKNGERVVIDVRSIQEKDGTKYVFFKLNGENEIDTIGRFKAEYPGVYIDELLAI